MNFAEKIGLLGHDCLTHAQLHYCTITPIAYNVEAICIIGWNPLHQDVFYTKSYRI